MRGWEYGKATRFAPEVRERAVRLVRDHQAEYATHWAAITSIAKKIACVAETLRLGSASSAEGGAVAGVQVGGAATAEGPGADNGELRCANEMLRQASAYFAQAELDRRVTTMVAFIDAHGATYGVEPICRVLPIAPSTYDEAKACEADPTRRRATHARRVTSRYRSYFPTVMLIAP